MSRGSDRSTPAMTSPALEPVPVEGCGVCGALVKQREEARAAGAHWTVRECNEELRNHPHN